MLNATHKTIAVKLDKLESIALANKRPDQHLLRLALLTDVADLRVRARRTSPTDRLMLNRISRHATALRSAYNGSLQHYYATSAMIA